MSEKVTIGSLAPAANTIGAFAAAAKSSTVGPTTALIIGSAASRKRPSSSRMPLKAAGEAGSIRPNSPETLRYR